MKNLDVLNPKKALTSAAHEKLPSILPLLQALPRIATLQSEHELIGEEWRNLLNFELPEDIKTTDPIDVFWDKLLHWDGEDPLPTTFKKLASFALDAMSLPHSNAECERVFSRSNLAKTKITNRMETSTLNGILLAKDRLDHNCVEFEPTEQDFEKMTTEKLYRYVDRKTGKVTVNMDVDAGAFCFSDDDDEID